jgi:mRNA-degrading endonuclease RelE of RelBE toxin-antitoxin system
MVFKLQFSRTAQKALDKLPSNALIKIFTHLEELKRDPYRPRPLADIVPVAGSKTVYRLRIGKLRVEYEIFNSENSINISKIFQKKRKSDYR